MKTRFIEPTNLSEGLGIPYPKSNLPGSKNIGYFDLKRYPSRIEAISELKGWDELKGLVTLVNKTDSIFRSLRCDVAQNRPRTELGEYKISSYVTVAFEILDWNVKENYKQLYDEFLLFARSRRPVEHSIVEFELVPTSYNDHSLTAWSVDIWNSGFGNKSKESRKTWAESLRVVKGFIQDQNQKYSNQLLQERRKIGDPIS